MDKPPIVYVNISSSFASRARCKKCGEGPSFFYFSRKPFYWKEVSDYLTISQRSRRWMDSMSPAWYLDAAPKHFHSMDTFSFTLVDKHYLPTLHRVRGAELNTDNDLLVPIVSCSCGYTTWIMNNLTKHRPEITNRKGRYNFPKKFE